MISPYVRRLRLSYELRALRDRANMTHPQVASTLAWNRAKISRIENAHVRPDLHDIMKLLDLYQVAGEEWTTLVTIARDAAERGWWESSALEMGERQARTCDLEAGAVTIQEYSATYPPGLLQTERYTRALIEWDDLTLDGTPADPDAIAEARAGRQRMLYRRLDDVRYEVILDESAIIRPSAPHDVFAEQLLHLSSLQDPITLRVLPSDAHIEHWSVPKASFSRYGYRDPDDPIVVAVDTVTEDLTVTDPGQVHRYDTLYARLRAAALSARDSADLLRRAAGNER